MVDEKDRVAYAMHEKLMEQLQQFRTEERKLEYLENLLKKDPGQETRKTIFIMMATLQAQKRWYNSSAKSYSNAADLSKTFKEKIDLLLKSTILFTKASDYGSAEDMIRKAVVLGSSKEKEEIRESLVNIYLKQAQEYEGSKMFNKTIRVLNRLLTLKIDNETRKNTQLRLIYLYEKVGQPIEANKIRQQMAD